MSSPNSSDLYVIFSSRPYIYIYIYIYVHGFSTFHAFKLFDYIINSNPWLRNFNDFVYLQSTNRSLLRWLKLWDFAVFGIQTKTVLAKANEAKVKKKETFGANKPFTDQKLLDGSQDELLDKQNRPIYKVVYIYNIIINV